MSLFLLHLIWFVSIGGILLMGEVLVHQVARVRVRRAAASLPEPHSRAFVSIVKTPWKHPAIPGGQRDIAGNRPHTLWKFIL